MRNRVTTLCVGAAPCGCAACSSWRGAWPEQVAATSDAAGTEEPRHLLAQSPRGPPPLSLPGRAGGRHPVVFLSLSLWRGGARKGRSFARGGADIASAGDHHAVPRGMRRRCWRGAWRMDGMHPTGMDGTLRHMFYTVRGALRCARHCCGLAAALLCAWRATKVGGKRVARVLRRTFAEPLVAEDAGECHVRQS